MRLYLFVQLATGRFSPPHRLQAAGSQLYVAWDADSGCRFTPIKWMPMQQQGVSRCQQARLDIQSRVRAVGGDHLRQMVDDTFALLDKRRAEGARPERLWSVEVDANSTPFLGDVFVR